MDAITQVTKDVEEASPAARARAKELDAQIIDTVEQIGRAGIRLGGMLKEVRDQHYFAQLGYSSFAGYFEARGMDSAGVYSWINAYDTLRDYPGIDKLPDTKIKILGNLLVRPGAKKERRKWVSLAGQLSSNELRARIQNEGPAPRHTGAAKRQAERQARSERMEPYTVVACKDSTKERFNKARKRLGFDSDDKVLAFLLEGAGF